MKRISTPLAPTLSPTFNPTSDDYFTAWGLAIYGNGNKHSGLDPASAAKNLEVCTFFQSIGKTSDQALNYWKWHVCDLYKVDEKDYENTVKIWKDLFISKAKEMQQLAAKCDEIYKQPHASTDKFFALLDPVSDISLHPKANREVQYHIALTYSRIGETDEAFKYYKLSANQGHADAQFKLGNCYWNKYVDKDDHFYLEKAFNFYKLAADQGNLGALEELGNYYKSGNCCSIDLKKAFECYKKLADLGGDPLFAAECYQKGEGVPVNFEEALKYYKMKVAYCEHFEYVDDEDDTEYDQLESIWDLVSLWQEHGVGGASEAYMREVEKGSFKSKFDLIKKYEYGIAFATNFEETIKLYELAKELDGYGYVPKINFYYKVGLCHQRGSTVGDLQKAFTCYFQAAPFDQPSLLAVARSYADGVGTPVNDEEAIRYYKAFFKRNKILEVKENFTDIWIMTTSDAFLEKATCYEYGYGTPFNLKEAVKYYKLAAEALKQV